MSERKVPSTIVLAGVAGACFGAAVHAFLQPSKETSSTTKVSAASSSTQAQDEQVKAVVLAFLEAQTKRDLDLMCSLAHEDILYINEPHPPERAIKGRTMFRNAFADSPCIWCPEANLQILQSSHSPGSDTVFVERLDQFLIDGFWLRIPINGYLKVKDGKVILWKDYWDAFKYKEFVKTHYGPDFRLFRRTLPENQRGGA